MPKLNNAVSAQHALIGTWITEEEDSNVAFTVSLENSKLRVSGFCRSDGEEFEITHVKWDGRALSFIARMPSTDTTTKNVFRLRPDGKADFELTTHEVWKKKDVKPGDIPEAWSAGAGRAKAVHAHSPVGFSQTVRLPARRIAQRR